MLEALLPDYHIWIKVTSGAVIPLIVDGPLDDNGTLSTATSVTSGAVFQHRPRERLCLLTLRVGRPAHTHCDNAHAATLGLPGVIATMDGSSRSGM